MSGRPTTRNGHHMLACGKSISNPGKLLMKREVKDEGLKVETYARRRAQLFHR